MKTLEMWYYWIQKNKAIVENSDASEDELKEARADLFKLSGAMHDNKPRKSRNQSFKLFVYNHLKNELSSVWYRLPSELQGRNLYL